MFDIGETFICDGFDRAETMRACVLLFFIKQNGARREEQHGNGEITFTVTSRKNIVT